ncbi:MAG: flippase-like domain-containing protein [Herpetosiphonaceae bacterium]|nr:flippase-like domain-containing protein [Herpetosiphonaceae bacterium]
MRLSTELETAIGNKGEQGRGRTVAAILIVLVMLVLLYRNRAELLQGIALARTARPFWLLAAFATTMFSYLISSQVFRMVLQSLGHRSGVVRLWGTAVTAIVISQAIPAGAVGSYAFLMASFKRRGVPAAQAAAIAAYEALSYVGAMLLIASFSLVYLGAHALSAGGSTRSPLTTLMAGLIALSLLGIVAFILTRSEATLTRGLQAIATTLTRLTGRGGAASWIPTLVKEFLNARQLVVTHTRMLGLLVVIQLLALSGHSLALLLVLKSLGVTTNFEVALTAFGFALITSTVNVLPGGGGTVETVLATVLTRLAIGPEAIPVSILFRLLNFWALLPLAFAGYRWLMRRKQHASRPLFVEMGVEGVAQAVTDEGKAQHGGGNQ